MGAITAVAIALAAGLGVGISSYVGAHQPGPAARLGLSFARRTGRLAG